MGNLEKAGVMVVVVLLVVILGVAFVNNDDDPARLLQSNKEGETPNRLADAGVSGGQNNSSAQRGGEVPRVTPSPEVMRGDEPEGRDPHSVPPVEPKAKPAPIVEPAPAPAPAPTPSPKLEPIVAPEWPKTVRVEKSDGSLYAIARRVYGAKAGASMVPAILKHNPKLKPTAMHVGDEIVMPELIAAGNSGAVVNQPKGAGVNSDLAQAAPKAGTGTRAVKKDDGKPKKRPAFLPAR